MVLIKHFHFSRFLRRFSCFLLVGGLGIGLTPIFSAELLSFDAIPGIEGTEYNPQVPGIEEVTGVAPGGRHTPPFQIIEYFEKVALSSDRVALREYGRSYEGVPLVCALVTSPANQAKLEEIRKNNLELTQNPGDISSDEIRKMPLVVYIGSGIHGNESSGGEAAMMLLYHLAAGQSRQVSRILDEMVVMIDPMINPDGRSRFTQWVNGNRGRSATLDLADREHNEPWPGGRTNHYWFDLNRDMLPGALQETVHRLELYYSWRPQLVTDHHEQGRGATFFFQPGIPTGNNPNTPQSTIDLTGKVAEYHAKALDRLGSLFASREVYDDFYYGKGSTYPDINGSVGILFEQASSRALRTIGTDGEMTYAFTIRNQFATMLSTLEAGLALRFELLENQRGFYLSLDDFQNALKVKGYLFSSEEDPFLAEEFIRMLHRHQIKVFRLSRDLEIGNETFRADYSWVVPVDQVQGRLVKAIFEEVTEFKDVEFYDVSTWTMPHAYGLRYSELRESPGKYLGVEFFPAKSREGGISGGRASYAYVMKWNIWAPAALYQILEDKIAARAFTSRIEIKSGGEKVSLDTTSVVIPLRQKEIEPEQVHQTIEKVASSYPVEIFSTDTGVTPSGPYLGSSSASRLRQPVVAVLTGPGISSREAGEAWYFLDARMGIPVSLLDLQQLEHAGLSDYTCLVLPSGSYDSLGEEEIARIRSWIREGGTLIAVRNAVKWLISSKLIDEEMVEEEKEVRDLPYAEVRKDRIARDISGSIFNTRLDTTHPLAFGLNKNLPVFRNHTDKLKPSRVPGSNVAVYDRNPLLSGYMPENEKGKIGETASIIARKSGSGSVVMFLDNPVFRGYWWGSARIFLNAVFLGNAF